MSNANVVPMQAQAPPPPKPLVMKLAEVMKAVERIPKNGRNEFHRYDYATEADIVTAIRGLLAERHIMLIPAIIGRSREPVGEKGSVLTHLDMEFTFMDGETGEAITRPWLGAGTDKEDKGAYKAMTGGEKYFLLKTFLIPTGDDPETDDVTHPQAQENRREFESRKQTPRPAPAAPSLDPDDPLPTDHVTTIVSVTSKKGEGKNGKPYTKYTITDALGVAYGTFSDSLAKIAIRCREQNTPVELRYETSKFGHDLTEIIVPREPGEEG